MSNEIDIDKLEQGLVIGAVGVGAVAALTPRIFSAVYGTGNDPTLLVMTRLFGSTTAALATLNLMGAIDSAKGNGVIAGLNALNTVLLLRADGIPKRTKMVGALSTAGFAAGFGYLAAQRR